MEGLRVGEMLAKAVSLQSSLCMAQPLSHSPTSLARRIVSRHAQNVNSSSRAAFSTTLRPFTPADHAQSPPRPQSQRPANSSPTTSGVSNDIASLLNTTLDGSKGTPFAAATRPSRFHSPQAQQANRNPGTPTPRQPRRQYRDDEDSVSDLMNLIDTIGNSPGPQARDMKSMLDPTGKSRNDPPVEAGPAAPPPRMDSTVGRTVHVDRARNMDVGRAFRVLEMTVSQNGIRNEFYRQRFHERPGLKRKRLKMENWRRFFKEQFKMTVSLVKRMHRQGW